MNASLIPTAIRPGVTDVRDYGEHVRITDHTRALEDGRCAPYAVQYSAPIGPEAPVRPVTPALSFPRYAYFAQDDVFVVVTGAAEHREVPIAHPHYGDTSVHEDALSEVSDADARALPELPAHKFDDDASLIAKTVMRRDATAFGTYLGAVALYAQKNGDVDVAFGTVPPLAGLEHQDPSPFERRLVAILVSGI